MPIATVSRTRLGPWGVSARPYGDFTGRAAVIPPVPEVIPPDRVNYGGGGGTGKRTVSYRVLSKRRPGGKVESVEQTIEVDDSLDEEEILTMVLAAMLAMAHA